MVGMERRDRVDPPDEPQIIRACLGIDVRIPRIRMIAEVRLIALPAQMGEAEDEKQSDRDLEASLSNPLEDECGSRPGQEDETRVKGKQVPWCFIRDQRKRGQGEDRVKGQENREAVSFERGGEKAETGERQDQRFAPNEPARTQMGQKAEIIPPRVGVKAGHAALSEVGLKSGHGIDDPLRIRKK